MIRVINLDSVSCVRDGNVILDNLNFDIEKGSFVSIIGSNGSGKSTLVKVLAGIFEYNGYIGNPIRIRYNIDAIDDGDIQIIDYVIDRLKQYRDSVLVDLSHEDDGPWYRHRLDRSIIKKEEIEEYFMGLQNS